MDDGLAPGRADMAAFVLSLRASGILDVAVLRALETVPRDLFAPRAFTDLARSGVALPLACGQTMSAPATVAQMLVALDVKPGQRVLEIGTGSGFVTALLVKLGGRVRSIERQRVLCDGAAARLEAAGLVPEDLVCDDGLTRTGDDVRYDRIILNGTLPEVPSSLTSRLAPGGRLVGGLPLSGGLPRIVVMQRLHDGNLVRNLGGSVRLSPLVAAKN